MRVAVTGRNGQLGRWLVRLAEGDARLDLVGQFGRGDADFADPDAVPALLDRCQAPPDWWLNAVAYTAVDRCEEEEDLARRVNAESPGVLAAACRDRGIGFAHVSTDFVFDGEASRPYLETAPTRPLGAYGRTKLEGERTVRSAHPEALVVRTSWVYGPGHNFVRTMIGQARKRSEGEVDTPLSVVADQRGRPTYSADLARAILQLAQAGAGGIVNFANDGEATWWDLARAALDLAGYESVSIEKIRARDYGRAAPTPMYSVLDLGRVRALGVAPRPWRVALEDYLTSDDRPLAEKAA
jgi:dTDP-4-dehydrorhamnose reductase